MKQGVWPLWVLWGLLLVACSQPLTPEQTYQRYVAVVQGLESIHDTAIDNYLTTRATAYRKEGIERTLKSVGAERRSKIEEMGLGLLKGSEVIPTGHQLTVQESGNGRATLRYAQNETQGDERIERETLIELVDEEGWKIDRITRIERTNNPLTKESGELREQTYY